MNINTTPDGYCLLKSFHKDQIKFIIDTTKFNIPRFPEFAWVYWRNNKDKEISKENMIKSWEDFGGQDHNPIQDEYYFQDILKYDSFNDATDFYAWYNDIGCLSGSAGYIFFRGGFVHATRTIIRS